MRVYMNGQEFRVYLNEDKLQVNPDVSSIPIPPATQLLAPDEWWMSGDLIYIPNPNNQYCYIGVSGWFEDSSHIYEDLYSDDDTWDVDALSDGFIGLADLAGVSEIGEIYAMELEVWLIDPAQELEDSDSLLVEM